MRTAVMEPIAAAPGFGSSPPVRAEGPVASRSAAPPAAAAEFEVRAATPEMVAELERRSRELEGRTPQEILSWAVATYYPKFTMATGLGPEGCTIIAMLAKIEPRVYVFNLDTGYQFQETLDLRDRIAEKYGIEVDLQKPDLPVVEYEALHGGPLYKTDPDRCCFDRKVRVLHRVAKHFDAWATGIRRDQSPTRADTPIVRWDKKFGLVKISPLAAWTKKDVWAYIMRQRVPYNPLHDRGYPSIGCRPCTRSIVDGEDERAGRWSGIAKTECGLHTG